MDRPVPVLQLVNQFAIGGAESQFVARLRGHPEGFKPIVGCLKREGPFLKEVESLGLRVEHFDLKGTLLQPNTAWQIARVAALIARERAQLVHAQDFYANVIAVPAARIAGAKVIVSRFDLGHWYSRAHHAAEALATRAADAVYANAHAVRQMCVREEGVAPEKVEVVPNGLDLPAFDEALRRAPRPAVPELEPLGPDGRSARPTIAVVANLLPVKRHLDLIEAAQIVRRSFPEVLVLCAGEGSMRQLLEQQIAQRGLTGNVLLLGHRLDVPALLARSHLACLPSHAEGLSNAVIEAMAARLPIVASAVGGNVELVRDEGGRDDTGRLVRAHDPRALAAMLLELLADEALRRRLGERARRHVEAELTLDAMRARTGELYQRVLSRVARAA